MHHSFFPFPAPIQPHSAPKPHTAPTHRTRPHYAKARGSLRASLTDEVGPGGSQGAGHGPALPFAKSGPLRIIPRPPPPPFTNPSPSPLPTIVDNIFFFFLSHKQPPGTPGPFPSCGGHLFVFSPPHHVDTARRAHPPAGVGRLPPRGETRYLPKAFSSFFPQDNCAPPLQPRRLPPSSPPPPPPTTGGNQAGPPAFMPFTPSHSLPPPVPPPQHSRTRSCHSFSSPPTSNT